MRKQKYAPRIARTPRKRSPAMIDPLHRKEVQILARQAGTSESFILDEILKDFFQLHSPYYGEEV